MLRLRLKIGALGLLLLGGWTAARLPDAGSAARRRIIDGCDLLQRRIIAEHPAVVGRFVVMRREGNVNAAV